MAVVVNGIEGDTAHSFEVYRSLISELFDTRPNNGADADFSADLSAAAIGDMFVHWGDHGAARYQREADRVRMDGLDEVAVMLINKGEWNADFAGERHRLSGGDLFLIDRSKPLVLDSQDNNFINVNIPRHLLEGLGVNLDRAHGQMLKDGSAEVLADVLRSICRHGVSGTEIQQGLVHFVAAAVLDRNAPERMTSFDRIVDRAREIIAANIGDEALDAQMLCDRLGISRAKLYRAFSPYGGVASYIRNTRLRMALRILRANPQMSISTLAFDLGFATHSHFSTVFRQRFGVSPKAFATRHALESIASEKMNAQVRLEHWEAAVRK